MSTLFCAFSILFFFLGFIINFSERRLQIYEKEYNSYNIAHTVNIYHAEEVSIIVILNAIIKS